MKLLTTQVMINTPLPLKKDEIVSTRDAITPHLFNFLFHFGLCCSLSSFVFSLSAPSFYLTSHVQKQRKNRQTGRQGCACKVVWLGTQHQCIHWLSIACIKLIWLFDQGIHVPRMIIQNEDMNTVLVIWSHLISVNITWKVVSWEVPFVVKVNLNWRQAYSYLAPHVDFFSQYLSLRTSWWRASMISWGLKWGLSLPRRRASRTAISSVGTAIIRWTKSLSSWLPPPIYPVLPLPGSNPDKIGVCAS